MLKGAMLFVAWGSKVYRPTKDLDLPGFGSANVPAVADRIREICSVPAEDGIVFDVAGMTSPFDGDDLQEAPNRSRGLVSLRVHSDSPSD